MLVLFTGKSRIMCIFLHVPDRAENGYFSLFFAPVRSLKTRLFTLT